MTEISPTQPENTPRDITLDDLAQRYPDTADLVKQVVIEGPQLPPSGGGGGNNRIMWSVVIPFFVSLAAAIAFVWLIDYWPAIMPAAAENIEEEVARDATEIPSPPTPGEDEGKSWPE